MLFIEFSSIPIVTIAMPGIHPSNLKVESEN